MRPRPAFRFVFIEWAEWQDRLALFLTAISLFALAAVSDKPRSVFVDGKLIKQAVIGGRIVPDWLLLCDAALAVILVYPIWRWAVEWLWPSRRWKREEQLHPLERGEQLLAWVRSGPFSKPGPREPYKMPTFGPETTPADFLATLPPYGGHRYIEQTDGALADINEFNRRQCDWLLSTPEGFLKSLLPSVESILRNGEGVVQRNAVLVLMQAHDLRGIPTLKELDQLAERSGSGYMKAMLDHAFSDLREQAT